MGNHRSHINNKYPDDVIYLILMQVDIVTLMRCHRICRQFARVLKHPKFWRDKISVSHQTLTPVLRSPGRRIITRYAMGQRRTPLIVFNPDTANFASTIGLEVQLPLMQRYQSVNVCRQCHSPEIVRYNTRVHCKSCKHISSIWTIRRVEIMYFEVSKPPDYRFPY